MAGLKKSLDQNIILGIGNIFVVAQESLPAIGVKKARKDSCSTNTEKHPRQ